MPYSREYSQPRDQTFTAYFSCTGVSSEMVVLLVFCLDD